METPTYVTGDQLIFSRSHNLRALTMPIANNTRTLGITQGKVVYGQKIDDHWYYVLEGIPSEQLFCEEDATHHYLDGSFTPILHE